MHWDFEHVQTWNILRCVHVCHIENMFYSVPNDFDLNKTHRSVCFDFSNRWRLGRCSSCSQIELVSVFLCCRKSSVVVRSDSGAVVAVVVLAVWRKISLVLLLVWGRRCLASVMCERRIRSLRCRMVTTVWWLGSIEAEVPIWRRSRWWETCTSAVQVRSSIFFLMVRLRTRCRGWWSMSTVAVIGVAQWQTIYFRFDSFEWCWESDLLARHWHCCLFGFPCSFDGRIECRRRLLQDVLSDWWFQACLDGVAHVVIGENGFLDCRWWLVAYVGQLHKCSPIRRVSVFDSKLRIRVGFSWAVLVRNVVWNCRRVERHRFSRRLRVIGTINTLVLSTAMERVPLDDHCWNFFKRARLQLVEAMWSRLLSVRRKNSESWGHCPLRSNQGWR